MKRIARITRVTPEYLEATIEAPLACAGCTGSCHTPIIPWLAGGKNNRLTIYRHAGQKQTTAASLIQGRIVDTQQFFADSPCIGQRFAVVFDESALLFSAFWLYAMPLLLMLSGLITGYFLFDSLDYSADLGGLLGLLGGLVIGRVLIARLSPRSLTPIRFF